MGAPVYLPLLLITTVGARSTMLMYTRTAGHGLASQLAGIASMLCIKGGSRHLVCTVLLHRIVCLPCLSRDGFNRLRLVCGQLSACVSGAEVQRLRPVSITHPEHPVNVARRRAEEVPGAVFADQFENLANLRAHLDTGGSVHVSSSSQDCTDAAKRSVLKRLMVTCSQ